MNDVVIVSACRTPIGSFRGSLSSLTAPRLGAIVIREAVRRAGLTPEDVDEVIMGNVARSRRRTGARAAGGHLCGTCRPSVEMHDRQQGVRVRTEGRDARCAGDPAGDADVVVAGGMESMSNAPYLLEKARDGYRMGQRRARRCDDQGRTARCLQQLPHGERRRAVREGMRHPARGAGRICDHELQARTGGAEEGKFATEIVAVEVEGPKGESQIVDRTTRTSRRPISTRSRTLKPAFTKDGTITAANASKISDGAAALVLMSAEKAQQLGVKPLARIVAQASCGEGAGVVHHRPRRRDSRRSWQKAGLTRRRHRPLRNQRGVCGCGAGGEQARGSGSGEGECQRRSDRARTSDRRKRSAHSCHAAPCARAAEPEARPGDALHRRRRGECGDRGTMIVADASTLTRRAR